MNHPVHGWVILNKPAGKSSTFASSFVKRKLKCKKAGHAGTLDPFASGVLPIALGEATKTIPYLMADCKSYNFTVVWGESRTTDDITGEISATGGIIPNENNILEILPKFTGTILQKPPVYSAIKIAGKRLYKRARSGENISSDDIPTKTVHIDSLKLLIHDAKDNKSKFSVDCQSGMYVRSLARDIAEKLGTFAYVSELCRTRVGKFTIEDTILLEKLDEIPHNSSVCDFVLPVRSVLDDIPAVPISEQDESLIRNGMTITVANNTNTSRVALYHRDKLVAIADNINGCLKPIRVFNIF